MKRGADYIVGIKGNQKNLESEVHNFFDQSASYGNTEGITRIETLEKGRRCIVRI